MKNINIRQCPICHSLLGQSFDESTPKDFVCTKDNHFYTIRLKDNVITKMKLRIDSNIVKIHFDDNYSEVWRKRDTKVSDHTRIEGVLDLDFSDINQLHKKLDIYLTFS